MNTYLHSFVQNVVWACKHILLLADPSLLQTGNVGLGFVGRAMN